VLYAPEKFEGATLNICKKKKDEVIYGLRREELGFELSCVFLDMVD
jgi:hypothetical protein